MRKHHQGQEEELEKAGLPTRGETGGRSVKDKRRNRRKQSIRTRGKTGESRTRVEGT